MSRAASYVSKSRPIEIEHETSDRMFVVTGHLEWIDPDPHAATNQRDTFVVDEVDELFEIPGQRAWGNHRVLSGAALEAAAASFGSKWEELARAKLEVEQERHEEECQERRGRRW